jgi:hypothetical protein
MDVKSSQATGNAAMHYAGWQLARRGWNVVPTSRNAKGSDLFCASDSESIIFGVQSKGLSKRQPVPLGDDLDKLRSDWWIITINAKDDQPRCFILSLAEVKSLCAYSPPERNKTGKPSHWLQPTAYDQPEFEGAWNRLGQPANVA